MVVGASQLLLCLRCVPPGLIIIGSSVTFLNHWAVIRVLTTPLPSWLYHRLEQELYSSYQRVVGFFYEVWSGVEWSFYGDQIPNEPENVIYLSNHQSSVDWVVPEVLCVKQGGYGGRAKYILKDILRFLPLYGWYLGYRGGIFVRRGRGLDHESLIRGLKGYADNKTPLWLVIFPEGTRYSVGQSDCPKRVRSREFARSEGLTELQHLLTPRTTGFESAVSVLRTHVKAVYDVTVYYEGPNGRVAPDLFRFFTGQCFKAHVHIRRTPIEDIPKTTEGQRAWLYHSYSLKEKLLGHVIEKGVFPGDKYSQPLTFTQYVLPLLLIATPVVVGMATKYGRYWLMSSAVVFTIVTMASGVRSRLK